MTSAHALSVNGASAASAPVDRLPNQSSVNVDSVMLTIDRLNRNNPAAAMRIEVALLAGQSELVAAIVQAVRTCVGDVSTCIHTSIVRAGGLSNRNLVSLAELAAALEAIGVSPEMIAAALDAYSTEVAMAVTAGIISEQFAALTLAGGSSDSLYL